LVQKGSMAKRVIVIVLLLLLALFVYVGYHSYDTKRTGTNGEVYTSGTARRIEPDTRQQSSEPDTIVYPTSPAGGTVADQPQGATAATQPSAAQAASTQTGATQVTQTQQPAGANAPASDTISPNPPNGMTFSGSGRYQLYRQGNITWRLDTDTGRSCVIFATDDEWRKPRVYRAGCGKS
jgi:hypothetical protein